MNKEEYLNNNSDFIYSRMYGNKYINMFKKELDKIIKIKKGDLEICDKGLFYQWGISWTRLFYIKMGRLWRNMGF